MAHRAVSATLILLLVLGLSSGAGWASQRPGPKHVQTPVAWFLTIQDRVGRAETGGKVVIYDNPLHCERGGDDCDVRGIADTHGALWLPDATNGLRKINPATGRAANSENGDRYSSAPVVWDNRLWFTAVDKFFGVAPPSTGVAVQGSIPRAYVEDLDPSARFLWAVGSGSTSSGPAVVARLDTTGQVTKRFIVPVSGEIAPLVTAASDQTAYVVSSPTSNSGSLPSQLFRVSISSAGATRVQSLGDLTFEPGAIVALDGHLWVTDANAPRLVELSLDGTAMGQVNLSVAGAGNLISASGRLWYMGSSESGSSVLEVIDPKTGVVTADLNLPLPKDDAVFGFTVVS